MASVVPDVSGKVPEEIGRKSELQAHRSIRRGIISESVLFLSS